MVSGSKEDTHRERDRDREKEGKEKKREGKMGTCEKGTNANLEELPRAKAGTI